MKKLLISIILPTLQGGGAERLHVYLANNWAMQEYSVEFVLMRKYGELFTLLSEDINVIELGVDRIRQAISPLRAYLKQSKPDIILSAMWPLTSATVISWLLSGKQGQLFLSDHNYLSVSCIKTLNVSPLFLKFLMRVTYPFANGIIAVSQGVKEDLCRLGKFSDNEVEVIYNPAATGASLYCEERETRENIWGKGFKHHILSVGSLKRQKDHATLIRAFAQLSGGLKVKLTILGEGPLRGELETLVNQLGLEEQVVMPGFITDPKPWFRTADIFVLSSQWEGFGNVLVEALECGVPVVSTDCTSGPSEILDNGLFGKLVPVGDVAMLAQTIEESLLESHDHDALIRRSKDFSVDRISTQYLNFFGIF
ncbi:MAG: glycosyltransferase [Candidatus Electrothrix sp. LOE1_4_5]|nr:glycosyltransferase [Candidatus Electrothrix gigas]